jgi:hypothetical protein
LFGLSLLRSRFSFEKKRISPVLCFVLRDPKNPAPPTTPGAAPLSRRCSTQTKPSDDRTLEKNNAGRRFDAWLRAQDPRHGVRDLEDVEALAEGAGLELAEAVEMPANNLAALFRPKKANKGPGPRP